MFKEYKNVWALIAKYYAYYGGARKFFFNPYLHMAVVVTALLYGQWAGFEKIWWSDVLQIIPSLLGFTLGAYAILISFGDEKFHKALIGGPGEENIYLNVSAIFLNFLVTQIFSIVLALIGKSKIVHDIASCVGWMLPLYIFNFIAYLLFILSIFLTLAASMGIFRVSTWYGNKD